MDIALICIVVIMAAVLYRVLRSAPKPAEGSATSARVVRSARAAGAAVQARDEPFQSVSIKCGPGACEEALALGERRFLAGRMRKLPLPGCTSPQCNCKFEHYSDRRKSSGDKRAPTALRSELYTTSGKPERRNRPGRRRDDFR